MKLMLKLLLYIFVIMALFAIPSVIFVLNTQEKAVNELAHIRAKSIYQMIVITRQWVADNRDQVAPVPAVVTKELSKYADVMATFKFHITSDKLVNPENAPDEFEKKVLQRMKDEHLEEYSETITNSDNSKVYRYAAPLFINESCLTCHDTQDYRLNDVRGLISISFSLDELEMSIAKNNRVISFFVFFGLILIITIFSLLVYLMVVRRLISLQKAVESMRNGNRIQTNIRTNDELQTLSEAFDQMSAQIANNEELLKYNLQQATSKYIGLVKELEDKNERLDSLNKLKSDLLDSVAHEIRTPLTKILSYSELLQDSRVLMQDEIRDKFANSMKKNINVITSMFNDIITLSRLEHDQHKYHKIPVHIKTFMDDIIENMEMEINSKQLEIYKEIEDYTIYVDGETFSIAMSNILSNAIKYSKKDGKVKITGKLQDDYYVIQFKDYGIGISEDDLGKLFERFHRGDNAKKEFPGTGLGLSIVARIIRDHGGEIIVNSQLNQWTIVTVKIPIFINNSTNENLNIEE